jgi:hypothetical protein
MGRRSFKVSPDEPLLFKCMYANKFTFQRSHFSHEHEKCFLRIEFGFNIRKLFGNNNFRKIPTATLTLKYLFLEYSTSKIYVKTVGIYKNHRAYGNSNIK